MGVVDKVLQTFKWWKTYEVENLPAGLCQVRETYKQNEALLVAMTAADEQARTFDEQSNTPASANALK